MIGARVDAQAARAWARALTVERIANDLRLVADNPRAHTPAMRAELLREAARRLSGVSR